MTKPTTIIPCSWLKRMGTRSYLSVIGWSPEDYRRPVILVGLPWSNASSCNSHFMQLGRELVAAVEAAGGKAFVCGGPVVTDGMVMGAEGMKYSLPSRDMVADNMELMYEAYR